MNFYEYFAENLIKQIKESEEELNKLISQINESNNINLYMKKQITNKINDVLYIKLLKIIELFDVVIIFINNVERKQQYINEMDKFKDIITYPRTITYYEFGQTPSNDCYDFITDKEIKEMFDYLENIISSVRKDNYCILNSKNKYIQYMARNNKEYLKKETEKILTMKDKFAAIDIKILINIYNEANRIFHMNRDKQIL